jgi:hypothetical protein
MVMSVDAFLRSVVTALSALRRRRIGFIAAVTRKLWFE